MNTLRSSVNDPNDPHAHQPTLTTGADLERAKGVLILLHGRGATAQSILSLALQLDLNDVAAIAPQAANNTWYPNSFLAPLESNQPHLDSALQRVDSIVAGLLSRGLASPRIALLGFSQGACLTLEYVARHPRRYAGVMGLTGGLIGPPGTPHHYPGSLDGTPVFLGTSDPDPHVPFERVLETRDVMTRMNAIVELRRYPGMPHTINQEELDACRTLIIQAFNTPE